MSVSRRHLLRSAAQLAPVFALGLPWAAQAQPSPASAAAATKGRTVLTVQPTGGAAVDFDMAALEALPQQTFRTSTPWYPKPVSFTGPLLRDVLAAAGARGQTLRAVALNDYKVELPIADAARFNVIVARLLDGKPMPVRERGPLFIVYPFDTSVELKSEKYYSRSAWQLRRIEVS
ncbi:molybdopterin-dependent oxidoreductase [Aquincola tertiaricarbonis]|uniref:Molybdopterin-dependent oxidoreductase n=1 Tax=Aquincola tertiaricarbonis TaxID=391953 RepID=A0ABY4S734_AQUTE|nr:molybdopterin-dependent oxidoreductase [Aquincola tertiaricarbonis]URI06891.1 molybdopterin-dependent oxidoreductase [Aquincola tertiaricarbonis]